MNASPADRSPDERAFIEAVRHRSPLAVRAALAEYPRLREKLNEPWFDFGGTALNMAVGARNRELIDVLLDAGADIDARSDWSMGPFGVLHIARGELARYLVSRGATVDACGAARMGDLDALERILRRSPWRVHERGGDGQSPLHFAADVPTAHLLLDRGADIHLRCTDHHSTPVMYAAGDRPDVARFLLTRGARPDVFLAVCLDDAAMLDELIAARPDRAQARINEGELAAPPGLCLMYAWICQVAGGTRPPTVLHAASAMGREALVRRLIAAGAQVDARGGYDDATPLHFAAWHGRTDIARMLLEAGCQPSPASGPRHRQPPLGWAIVNGRVDTVRALLDAGVPVLDHYLREAEAGLRGEFDFARGRPEDYRQILDLLTQRSS